MKASCSQSRPLPQSKSLKSPFLGVPLIVTLYSIPSNPFITVNNIAIAIIVITFLTPRYYPYHISEPLEDTGAVWAVDELLTSAVRATGRHHEVLQVLAPSSRNAYKSCSAPLLGQSLQSLLGFGHYYQYHHHHQHHDLPLHCCDPFQNEH